MTVLNFNAIAQNRTSRLHADHDCWIKVVRICPRGDGLVVVDDYESGHDIEEVEATGKGCIYILINASLQKNFLKIGQTTKRSEDRANEISRGTGVVAPYMVAYDWEVGNCCQVEQIIHGELAEFRVNGSREFFSLPLKEAIKKIDNIIERYNLAEPEEIDQWFFEIKKRRAETEKVNQDSNIDSESPVQEKSRTDSDSVKVTGAMAGDILVGYKPMNNALKIQIHEDIEPEQKSGGPIAISFSVLEAGDGPCSEFVRTFIDKRFTYAGEMLPKINKMPGGETITHILNLNSLKVLKEPSDKKPS